MAHTPPCITGTISIKAFLAWTPQKTGILSLLFILAPLRVAQCPEHDSSAVKGMSGDLSITLPLACYCLPQTSPQIGATWKPEPHQSLRSD